MPPCFGGIDLKKRAIAIRVHLLKFSFLDEVLDAHPLDEHFSFGLIRFFQNAFGRGFFQDSFLLNMPAVPEIEFIVAVYDCRPVGTMDSPSGALMFRPHVSDEEDEPVNETEFRSKRKIWLETLPRALREVAKPAGKRLPANFPRKLRDQFFPD